MIQDTAALVRPFFRSHIGRELTVVRTHRPLVFFLSRLVFVHCNVFVMLSTKKWMKLEKHSATKMKLTMRFKSLAGKGICEFFFLFQRLAKVAWSI